MKNKDIIITGLQHWDIEIGSNCKNIAKEFSRNNRVLYVNPPLDRITAIKRYFASDLKGTSNNKFELEKVEDNLWVYNPPSLIESISRLSINTFFDILNKHNNAVFANDILKAIVALNFKNYIHFCDSDMFRSFYLKEMLKPLYYIYYTRDNLMAVKYWQTQGIRIEPKHMAKADLVMANSTYLADQASEYNSRSIFIGQGCDVTAYKKENASEIPNELRNIKGPIIGYIGALKSLRLDITLLERIAMQKPEWSIVLVGPEDDDFKSSKLHDLNNVYFLGSKKEELLPVYLKAFTVAINPQALNEVTIGNYPRKIDEYLAMGKPVVATKTKAMDFFKEHVSLALDENDWINKIEFELENTDQFKTKKRVAFASEHTWKNNVNSIYKILENQMYTHEDYR